MKAAKMPATKMVQRSVVERVNSGSCIKSFRRKMTELFRFLLALGNACEATAGRGRSLADGLAKRRGERACLVEAHGQSDFRHRRRGFHQQRPGALHAAATVVSMRRRTERLPEGPAKMVRTEANQP